MKKKIFMLLGVTALLLPFAGRSQSIVGAWHVTDIKVVGGNKDATEKHGTSNDKELKEMLEKIDFRCTFLTNGTTIWQTVFKGTGVKPVDIPGTYTYSGGRLKMISDMARKQHLPADSDQMTKSFADGVEVKWDKGNMLWHKEGDTEEKGKKVHYIMDWTWSRM